MPTHPVSDQNQPHHNTSNPERLSDAFVETSSSPDLIRLLLPWKSDQTLAASLDLSVEWVTDQQDALPNLGTHNIP